MEFPTNPSNPIETPVTAEIVHPLPPPPPPPPARRKPRVFRTLLILGVVLGLGVSLLVNLFLISRNGLDSFEGDRRVQERYFSHNRFAQDKVAIISVEGTIIESDGFVKRQIDRAKKDENVKAIVLRVDSPGGTVSGSDFILHHLRQLTKDREIPIVVSMGGLAASGGYYVSMAVGDTPASIFAEPATWTGSIGVKIPHYDLSDLLKEWGIKEDTIASHRLKTMGSLAKPMTDEEHKIFQGLVDESFSRFKAIIRDGRPRFANNPAELDKLATGQIYTSQQAVSSGLVDKIGFVEDAIDRAIELAKLDKDEVRVVKYKPETGLMSILMGGESGEGRIELNALAELTSPRAYYLYTSLPAAFANRR
jgi:protease IV